MIKRVGAFGYGRQGRFLVNLIRNTGRAEIGFVVEEKPQLLENLKQDFSGSKLPQTMSMAEFAERAEAIGSEQDGFSVVTTTSSHVPIIKHLAPLKKPIFVEKPFAGTYAESVEGWDALDKHKTPCFIGFQRRLCGPIKDIYEITRG